ncbi:MAG: carbohydrate kinase family protein [Candidatus Nezhaarchaeales archaeon]
MLQSDLVFVGHTSIDTIKNLNGTRTQPGGAALYASIAAKTLYSRVAMVTAIGLDYPYKDLIYRNFPPYGVKIVNLPSTRFRIEYDENWNAYYKLSAINAGLKLTVKEVLKPPLDKAGIVHLAPMTPAKVRRMVKALKGKNPKTLISINTCFNYLEKDPRNRRELKQAFKEADISILSEHELKLLVGPKPLTAAIRLIEAPMVVVTIGDVGALIREGDEIFMVPALTGIVKKPVDTTGAGDTWCGAFIAAYRITGDPVKSALAASVISALKCTGWNFERLLNLRFSSLDEVFEAASSYRSGGRQVTLLSFK